MREEVTVKIVPAKGEAVGIAVTAIAVLVRVQMMFVIGKEKFQGI